MWAITGTHGTGADTSETACPPVESACSRNEVPGRAICQFSPPAWMQGIQPFEEAFLGLQSFFFESATRPHFLQQWVGCGKRTSDKVLLTLFFFFSLQSFLDMTRVCRATREGCWREQIGGGVDGLSAPESSGRGRVSPTGKVIGISPYLPS